jgi:ubiquinone/menaquinone biosynthesis C-methylase UbiE
MKLHLGCGKKYMKGWVNCDINPHLKTDYCFDADNPKKPWPFKDNTFEEIYSNHVLEHCKNYLWVMSEIYRVCKNKAILQINVPYLTLTKYNLVNPYHHTYFNEYSFEFFDQLKGSANETNDIHLKTLKIVFHYLPEWEDKSESEKEFARKHYFNVCRSIDFTLKAIK